MAKSHVEFLSLMIVFWYMINMSKLMFNNQWMGIWHEFVYLQKLNNIFIVIIIIIYYI